VPTLPRRLALAAALAAPLPAAAGALSGSEIADLFNGARFSYSGPTSGEMRYTARRFVIEDSWLGRSQGRWFVKGDRFCRDFDSGFSHCTPIIANEDGSYTARVRGFRYRLTPAE